MTCVHTLYSTSKITSGDLFTLPCSRVMGQIPNEQICIHLQCINQVYLVEIVSNEHKVHTAKPKLSDYQEDVHGHPICNSRMKWSQRACLRST